MKSNFFLVLLVFLNLGCTGSSNNSDHKNTNNESENVASNLRHVVLFKFKESASQADIKKIELAFNEMVSKIPMIKDYEWGTNISPENLNKGFTHCYFLTFNSEKDRDEYLHHPAHLALGDILSPSLEDVLVVDYWTQ